MPDASALTEPLTTARAGGEVPVQLLTPEGERVSHPDYDVDLTDDEYRELYRDLVLVRRIDIEATALQRQGELGIWAALLGQEAAQVGSGRAMREKDFAFPTYREHGVAWCRGVDPLELLGLFRGVSNGGWDPNDKRFQLYTIVIGSQTLHATGYAMGIQKDGAVGRRRRRGRHRLLRRRREQPGRRQRGVRLGQRLQRAGRLLLPEQPVGHLDAHRPPDAHPAVPARGGLRLPGRARRRQRRAGVLRRDPQGARRRPPGAGPDARRGVHLPHGRAHHVRRPDPLPAGQRAGGVEAQGPARADEVVPLQAAARRRRLLRPARRRRRRARGPAALGLPGDDRPRRRARCSTTSTPRPPRCCRSSRPPSRPTPQASPTQERGTDGGPHDGQGAQRGAARDDGARPEGRSSWARTSASSAASSGSPTGCRRTSARPGSWTRRSPSPASSAPRSAWRCAATGRSARSSSTASSTRPTTRSSASSPRCTPAAAAP